MRKMLRWGGGALVILLVLLGGTLALLNQLGKSRLARAPEIPVTAIPVPTGPAAVERGQHVAEAIAFCAECHGSDFGGKVFLDAAPIGRVVASNLTGGRGGIGGVMTDRDWIRAIRHGVGHDGRVLAIMPSNVYAHLSDADLGAIIAFLKTLPPVDHELAGTEIRFPGTIFLGVLGYGSLPVSLIDHDGARTVSAPPAGVTVEYGSYLANACRECHGTRLAGLTSSHGSPPGPNLTPGGPVGAWTEEQFLSTIRTGVPPEGGALDPTKMPWPWMAALADDELRAIWLYVRSLSARELGDNQ